MMDTIAIEAEARYTPIYGVYGEEAIKHSYGQDHTWLTGFRAGAAVAVHRLVFVGFDGGYEIAWEERGIFAKREALTPKVELHFARPSHRWVFGAFAGIQREASYFGGTWDVGWRGGARASFALSIVCGVEVFVSAELLLSHVRHARESPAASPDLGGAPVDVGPLYAGGLTVTVPFGLGLRAVF